MIKNLAHLAFDVKDMEKSLHFYCELLGITKAFQLFDQYGNPTTWYLKISDGQFIELFYGRKDCLGDSSEYHSYHHLCLEVDDINEIAERIKNSGLTIDHGPVQGKDLNYQCWVRDPDGNKIEFMQMNPDSPQRNC
jgi:catechol 2,3-dioxygenase-like lactoylglutathione lyase family enzyme